MGKPVEKRQARAQNDVWAHALETDLASVTLACECGHEACTEQLTIGKGMYRKIRHHAGWYLLATGHEVAAGERVVFRQRAFVVVETA